MLSDALKTLQTFDIFQAFRVGSATESGARLASELAWDPPIGADWNAASRVARSLHGRADQLFLGVSNAHIDPSLWRQQRSAADSAHVLIDLGDALQAYRDRVDRLPSGDAAGALLLLDRAWSLFQTAAERWGTDRGEIISGTG
jgi:hypothetical protein